MRILKKQKEVPLENVPRVPCVKYLSPRMNRNKKGRQLQTHTQQTTDRRTGRQYLKCNICILSKNELPIKRVKSFNFLGIILNETLTWTDHIAHLSRKISPVISLLHRLKNSSLYVYSSLILSRLHYGNILWGRTPGHLIKTHKKHYVP